MSEWRISLKLVEQVLCDGTIEEGYDNSLSPSEIRNIIKLYFPNYSLREDGLITCEHQGKKFSLRVKNITYLGHPHPIYKKRIQISDDLRDFYSKSLNGGYIPLLLGIYSYKNNYLFCDFNIDDYIEGKSHNSSAHVYVSDLQAATQEGFFQKVDYFNNKITVFARHTVKIFLEDKISDTEFVVPEAIRSEDDELFKQYSPRVIDKTFGFFDSIDKNWFGISCYSKMIEDNYRNKYQPEWPAFFLEYSFENYICKEQIEHLIKFEQNKKKDGIDLDLFFDCFSGFGDLKMHSKESRGIQGNDWDTIFGLLNGDEFSRHILYLVWQHSTNKDRDFDFEVTRYWNSIQNKDNPLSYGNRMKHDVSIESVHVLDINPSNCKYLSMFKQGINSNGKLRNPKIMIETDNMVHFEISSKKIS